MGKIIQVTQILLATILKILRMKAVLLAGELLLQLLYQRNPLKQLTAPDTRVVTFFNILFLNIYRVWGLFVYLFISSPSDLFLNIACSSDVYFAKERLEHPLHLFALLGGLEGGERGVLRLEMEVLTSGETPALGGGAPCTKRGAAAPGQALLTPKPISEDEARGAGLFQAGIACLHVPSSLFSRIPFKIGQPKKQIVPKTVSKPVPPF